MHTFDSIVSFCAENYRNYYTTQREVEINGKVESVELHLVGHNSTHTFYIGLSSSGTLVKMSCGEDSYDKDGYPIYKERIYTPKDIGYLGHF